MKHLLLELQKQKGRFHSLLFLSILAITYCSTITNKNLNALCDQGWLVLFYNQPIENSMFLPIVIALFASSHMDIEHVGNMWKHLYTFVTPYQLFFTKLLYGGIQIFIFCCLQIGVFFLIGKQNGFTGSPDFTSILYYFTNTLLVSLVLFLLHLLLSFLAGNQALSLCIGLAGSFYGLFALFLPKGIAELLPWGLYGSGLFIGMDYDPATRISTYYHIGYSAKIIGLSFFWAIALLLFTLFVLRFQDTEFSLGSAVFHREKHTDIAFHAMPVEFLKMKHSPAWLAFFILPLLSVIIGTFNYTANIDILQEEWYSLWSQHTLFLCMFFMPATVGVFCSCIWHVEHTGTNWNQLYVNVNPVSIYLQKFLVSGVISCLSILWIGFLFYFCGKVIGLSSPFPIRDFLSWIGLGCIGMLCICGLQNFLSLIVHNFVLPIGMGFVLGIVSLLLMTKGKYFLLPYSVMSVGMRANNPTMEIHYGSFLITALIHIVIYTIINIVYLKNADVKTNV